MAQQPIGVFDSGIGGLSVLRHLKTSLPHESFVYYADSAHAPYGSKSAEYITERSLKISDFLLSLGAKALVVACNTATSAAITTMRERLRVPIIGMEPGVKPATAATRSGVVGILATTGTLTGSKYIQLVDQFQHHARIINQPCPGLVERIEQGSTSDAETRKLLERYIYPLLKENADVLVLGCTHYPFVYDLVREIVGSNVTIIDTGPAIAREVNRRLSEIDALNPKVMRGNVTYWTSGGSSQVADAIEKVIAERVVVGTNPLL